MDRESIREIGGPTRVPADMIRALGGIVVGIACAIILMMIVEAIGNRIFPPPVGIDYTSPDAPAFMPFRSLIFPVIGWFVATLVGGWVAIWVSAQAWSSWPIAVAVLLGEVAEFLMGRHPGWMIIGGILLPLIAALLAQRLPRRSGPLSA